MNVPKDIRTNLNPEIWGPFGWFLFDSVCLGYPIYPTNDEKQQYKNFFSSLPYILPCIKCRYHFNQYMIKYPLNDYILNSKDKLIKWLLHAHNNINKINNKYEISLKDFYSYYNKKFNMDIKNDTCNKKCNLKQIELNIQDFNNINPVKLIKYNFKYVFIILFGILIALGLYTLRQNQVLILI
jgi:hypothetical protein